MSSRLSLRSSTRPQWKSQYCCTKSASCVARTRVRLCRGTARVGYARRKYTEAPPQLACLPWQIWLYHRIRLRWLASHWQDRRTSRSCPMSATHGWTKHTTCQSAIEGHWKFLHTSLQSYRWHPIPLVCPCLHPCSTSCGKYLHHRAHRRIHAASQAISHSSGLLGQTSTWCLLNPSLELESTDLQKLMQKWPRLWTTFLFGLF